MRDGLAGSLRSCLAGVCLAFVFATPGQCRTFDQVETAARALQSEWATVFYEAPKNQHVQKYKDLLVRVRTLKRQNPDRAEPLIVEAIILCTYSAAALGLDTLDMLEQARTLLQKSIDMDPPALDGAAWVTLGNLYRRLPGWPILYGDKQLARQYFESGVKLFPDGIDTNYFYGDFLIGEGDVERARSYLEKARHAPIRPSLKVSDQKLQKETEQALGDLQTGRSTRSDFFSLFTPDFSR